MPVTTQKNGGSHTVVNTNESGHYKNSTESLQLKLGLLHDPVIPLPYMHLREKCWVTGGRDQL